MASTVAYMVADGSEATEVIAPVDVLRRGGVNVTLVSVMGRKDITLSANIRIQADALIEDVSLFSDFQMVVIPGGNAGVENLAKCEELAKDLRARMHEDRLVAAICAGPTILADLGLLEGHRAVCYPGCETNFPEGAYQPNMGVCVDGNLITAAGPALALSFGKAMLHVLEGEKVAEDVTKGMLL